MTEDAARDLGLMLHRLLADLDPARWRDEKAAALEEAFENFRAEVDEVLAEWSTERGVEGVRQRLTEVQAVVWQHLPTSDDVKDRWMEFRQEIHPAYEGLAEALKTAHMELPSVRPTNYTRSFVHAVSAVVAVLFLQYAPWTIVLAVPIALACFFWFLEVMRRISDAWNDALMRLLGRIAHPHERYRVNSSTWFTTALSVLALTHEPIAAAAAVMVLGFGDPAAGIVGRKFGETKLIHGRSLEGTLAFVVFAAVAVLAVLRIWYPELGWGATFAIAGLASVTGALTELFSRRVDDNFAIPVVTGLAIWAMLLIL